MLPLDSEYNKLLFELDKLKALLMEINILSPKYQKAISELVLLRLFYVFENRMIRVSYKIASGFPYADGTTPSCLLQCTSKHDARDKMKNFNRSKTKNLKFSTASEICDNLKYIVDQNEYFMTFIRYNGRVIDELRRIRNRIAHNNEGSRREYQEVIKRYYGVKLNHITPGILLLSNKQKPSMIEYYVSQVDVFYKLLVKK